MDFRLVPNQDPEDVLLKLRAHLDTRGYTRVEIKKLVSLNSTKTKLENEYVQTCIKVFEDCYKVKPVINITSLEGGPAYNVSSVY